MEHQLNIRIKLKINYYIICGVMFINQVIVRGLVYLIHRLQSFSELYDAYENDSKIFNDKFLECIELWLTGSL